MFGELKWCCCGFVYVEVSHTKIQRWSSNTSATQESAASHFLTKSFRLSLCKLFFFNGSNVTLFSWCQRLFYPLRNESHNPYWGVSESGKMRWQMTAYDSTWTRKFYFCISINTMLTGSHDGTWGQFIFSFFYKILRFPSKVMIGLSLSSDMSLMPCHEFHDSRTDVKNHFKTIQYSIGIGIMLNN